MVRLTRLKLKRLPGFAKDQRKAIRIANQNKKLHYQQKMTTYVAK